MRVAVIGAGGIGAPLGASLATAGQDVTFLARGKHLAAQLIRRQPDPAIGAMFRTLPGRFDTARAAILGSPRRGFVR